MSNFHIERAHKDLMAAFDQNKLEAVEWIISRLPDPVDPEEVESEVMW